MEEQFEKHWAPSGKVYVHKEKETGLYGEMLFISPNDPYTIENFVLIGREELEEYFNPSVEEEPE